MTKSVTVKTLLKMKQAGQKIAMLTAYDHPTAVLLDAAGVHILLVGDSLGMVVQGQTTTIPVALEDIIYHTKMVSRGAHHSLIVADLPFLTYQISADQAMQNAAQLLREGGAQAVKLEGGQEVAATVQRIVQAGIPVMAHLGLTPQSVHTLGGFSVQGRTREAAERMLEDALALQQAGAFALVLEMVPAELAELITSRLSIPTIGIGAGPFCDGQVLVFHDMVGYTSGYIPKHNKRYANVAQVIQEAASVYIQEVTNGGFPGEDQTARLRPEEFDELTPLLRGEGQ
ncbi:3-methyl-2-oxobutanoate hydroxymethyltransferase [Alicyclobacillus tolerans]|uniref:3-methyl-2-oxobutanoate hydroxymethyltransferase n=1 Tax=Alicyclobacillus tolerans TaxID=90970 RepID=UPI001F00E864|nr:3-methyl-2-oxobutanoate hydroxymethyltransferase [Alicyclobacillus tolerans]MCF8566389.1 3-methyl-2-oxobutanoate hydroxymethyltransferase [Alicyclobacillus tolerans]